MGAISPVISICVDFWPRMNLVCSISGLVRHLATMNSAISQLEAFIVRRDCQRAHIELSLMDRTRPAQEQEQLEQTYDLLFELRQIAATSLAVVQRLERELAQSKGTELQ